MALTLADAVSKFGKSAKGVHSPRPAVEPIAKKMIWVATPGVTTADLSTFSYKHRRRPMYPFEAEARRS